MTADLNDSKVLGQLVMYLYHYAHVLMVRCITLFHFILAVSFHSFAHCFKLKDKFTSST